VTYRWRVLDTVLSPADWQARADAHAAAVAERTGEHLARRDRREKHPVEDFLWEYYSFTPARLARWHPGPGVGLADAAGMPRADWRHYRTVGDVVTFDAESFAAARGRTIDFVRGLLEATLSRPATLGCFGLHEWAMVHGIPDGGVRHENWPLRLGAAATDEVTRSHTIRCSHFDAFRFFTPTGAILNTLSPTRETQVANEQPGCLHAGMDVYKWCFKLEPLVPSDLVLDAFDLAREIRLLDMQASPYDLADLGVEPVRIETPEGKAEYVTRQRAFSERSNALRARLLDVLDVLAALPTADSRS
jgi:hypothetical protein